MGSLGWLWGAVGGFLAPLGRPWAGSWDLLGPSWASLGWSGPHLGWILGPRDSLGLDFRGSGDVPGRVLVCLGVAALCLELSLQEVGGTFHSTLSFQLTEPLLLLRARVLPWFLLLLALSYLMPF